MPHTEGRVCCRLECPTTQPSLARPTCNRKIGIFSLQKHSFCRRFDNTFYCQRKKYCFQPFFFPSAVQLTLSVATKADNSSLRRRATVARERFSAFAHCDELSTERFYQLQIFFFCLWQFRFTGHNVAQKCSTKNVAGLLLGKSSLLKA